MKIFRGRVISDKMVKVATVQMEWRYRHPLYGKIMKRKKKIHASNEIGAILGQLVEIREVRPLAKTVSFKITKIMGEKGEEKPTSSQRTTRTGPSQPTVRQSRRKKL